MRRSIVLPATMLIGLGSPAALTRAGVANFHLVDQSASVSRAAGTATFTLVFDRAPRFFGPHGGGGGQPNAFQLEVDTASTAADLPILFEDIDTVIRGSEIAAADAIPIRDRDGEGGDNAGGWGPVRELVPYDLHDETLSFTVGLSTLGDDGDGKFRYRVITLAEGGLTSDIQAAVIPLPAAVWTGITMLGGLGVARKLRRRS